MNTKETIIELADELVRKKGFNAFSFHDISKTVGIKTASVHYHFPTKTDLGVAVIRDHTAKLETLKSKLENRDPLTKLKGFLSIYDRASHENKVCLVGSLATDFNTVDERIREELVLFSLSVLGWVTSILEEGQASGAFHFTIPARTKALMIISNMLAIVQLSRLTGHEDFITVRDTIIDELTK
ncbi:TetR family transcriptional regulator [Emticicia sp. CRIBPO]|uniref:TetR/AcrR family transcriptional regulator n=1 Tax=Emticicia sp. CRIBPO TaxID=2683258 RepID=UPI001412B225|nr:TetR/AcrR family transcriptional regulator [Emticicia sp. CRIBPO]NBA88985.1 TetR family transcriptional regulator [Emticicia sp. CRIBPO]